MSIQEIGELIALKIEQDTVTHMAEQAKIPRTAILAAIEEDEACVGARKRYLAYIEVAKTELLALA